MTVHKPPREASTLLLLCALMGVPRCNASFAQSCARLSETDAIVFVDVQNCFMDSRPVREGMEPSYSIGSTVLDSNGQIGAGSLSVADASSIVDVVNAWIDFADGSPALLVATLDWHPAQHCSFCYVNDTTIRDNTGCLSGTLTDGNDMTDHNRRCRRQLFLLLLAMSCCHY